MTEPTATPPVTVISLPGTWRDRYTGKEGTVSLEAGGVGVPVRTYLIEYQRSANGQTAMLPVKLNSLDDVERIL